jgi:hypothetical protein
MYIRILYLLLRVCGHPNLIAEIFDSNREIRVRSWMLILAVNPERRMAYMIRLRREADKHNKLKKPRQQRTW